MSEVLLLLPACAVALAAATYAQVRIGHQVEGPGWVAIVRAALALVGAALGAMVATGHTSMTDAGVPTMTLVFLTVFGAVHVPAAVILHLKRLRGQIPNARDSRVRGEPESSQPGS